MSIFDWNTGKPTVFSTAKAMQYAARKAAQTAVVERKRKDGEDIGTVHGMSKKGDELRAQYMAREKRK